MSNFKRYYKNNNIVFLTIVTYNRNPILIENITIIRESLKKIKYEYKVIAGIVLQDHLHLLIQCKKASEFAKIIATFKSSFSREMPYNKNQTYEQTQRREKGIWQRKYYDHIIRNDEDLYKHLDYIHYNSYKHYKIVPKDWKYSSFKKFVAKGYYDINWCNTEDKYEINQMDLE